jgi:hypothetical protein
MGVGATAKKTHEQDSAQGSEESMKDDFHEEQAG